MLTLHAPRAVQAQKKACVIKVRSEVRRSVATAFLLLEIPIPSRNSTPSLGFSKHRLVTHTSYSRTGRTFAGTWHRSTTFSLSLGWLERTRLKCASAAVAAGAMAAARERSKTFAQHLLEIEQEAARAASRYVANLHCRSRATMGLLCIPASLAEPSKIWALG